MRPKQLCLLIFVAGATLAIQSSNKADAAIILTSDTVIAAQRPPAAPVEKVTNTYFGTTVVDPY